MLLYLTCTLFKGLTQVSFCLFSFFSTKIFYRVIVDLSGILTHIVGVEGEHADHLTYTKARLSSV